MKRGWMAGVLGLVAACAASKVGRLEANRFQHEVYPYAVFYEPHGLPLTPFGSAWRVENYEMPQGTSRYLPKTGPEYAVLRSYDLNGDGSIDLEQREPFYDLLLDHTGKEALLWVRTVPVSVRDREAPLAQLADRYVAAVAASGELVTRFGAEAAAPAKSPRVEPRVVHTQPCSLSKREAQRVDIELGGQRAGLVLVRSGYEQRVKDKSGRFADYPVLLMLGLRSSSAEFAALEPDFERLLTRTVLGDRGQGLSMVGEHTCSLSASSGAEQAPAGNAGQAPADGAEPDPTQTPGPLEPPAASAVPAP